jgi:translation initiation factor 5
MSTSMNIAGTTPVDDPEYRYKMPRLIAKIEGRGNGIKTVVVNAVDIAVALHRTPGEVTKFFGTELGAQSKYDPATERAVVNGAFEAGAMQTHLTKFIELFVLCPNCRLPETKYKYKGMNAIFHKCLACGAVEPVDMNHKLTTYLLKEHVAAKRAAKKENGDDKKEKKEKKKKKDKERDGSGGEEKEKKKKDKKDKKKKDKAVSHSDGNDHLDGEDAEGSTSHETTTTTTTMDEDKITWHTDLSEEAVAARAAEAEAIEKAAHNAMQHPPSFSSSVYDYPSSSSSSLISTKDVDASLAAATYHLDMEEEESAIAAATDALAAYIQSNQQEDAIISHEVLFEEVVRQQTCAALPLHDRLAIFFGAAFHDRGTIVKQVQTYAPVLARIMGESERSQYQLVALLEHFCAVKFPSLLPQFPIFLKAFYDAELVPEEIILTWVNPSIRKNYAHYQVSDKQAAVLQTSLAPFIEWLKNADEESSSGDDE